MNLFLVLSIVFVRLNMVLCGLPPPSKCVLSDAACIKASGQELMPSFVSGDPVLGIPLLDPLHVDSLQIELAGLTLSVRNADFIGLRTVAIDKLRFDTSKKQMQLSFHGDVAMTGQYKAGGMLLILPISGDGDVNIQLKNIKVDMMAPYRISKNTNGDDVIELKNFKYNYDVKDKVTHQLTNLFNGNKQLSEAMLTFMNENWKLLSQEFGRPIIDVPMTRLFKAIQSYLKSQPIKDIVNQ